MDRKRRHADAASASPFDRFKKATRVLECDENEAAFEKLNAIAQPTRPELPQERADS